MCKAARPIAVLIPPVVLLRKALHPIAVLAGPCVLVYKDPLPIAVLKDPNVLLRKAHWPIAVLLVPVAEELKFVVAPIEMFVEMFPPPVLISKLLIEPVTPHEPEMFTVFAAKSPFINGTPEPEAMYNLLLSLVVVEGPAASPIAILFEEVEVKFNPAD